LGLWSFSLWRTFSFTSDTERKGQTDTLPKFRRRTGSGLTLANFKAVRERLHFEKTSGVNWFKEIPVKEKIGRVVVRSAGAVRGKLPGSDVAG
jgi:hypothetical protein